MESTNELVRTILDQEQERADRASLEPEISDARLFGTSGNAMSIKQAVRGGAGWPLLALLFALQVVDEFDRVAMSVLAPDIQETLGVSDTVLGAVAGAGGVFFVLGAIPLGMAADRFRRVRVGGVATVAWGAIVFLTGFVANAFSLFWARMGAGLGQSNVLPVQNSLAADAYPIEARGRIFGLLGAAAPIGRATGPLVVGGIAAIAGGTEGWRWAFWIVSIPSLALGVVFLLAKEPERGKFDRAAHDVALDDAVAPTISFTGAFDRLKAIETFHALLVGIGALGFALFSVPLFVNVLLKDHFGLEAFDRGLVSAVAQVPAFVALPFVARRFDRVFRSSPPAAVRLMALLISGYGLAVAIAVWMPNVAMLAIGYGIATTFSVCGFSMLMPLMSAVIPFRLRSQGFAIVGIYIFLGGGFFGAVITGWMADAWGERLAITLVSIPSAFLGGFLLGRGARFIRRDMLLVVEEFEEETAERARRRAGEEVPVVQVRNLDFSYGPVQVLFDVDLDVHRGETLALLGTNGAGKSTLLRCLSGLGTPSRGVIRLNGSTITFSEPTLRVRRGIVQLPGGKALFGDLTIRENLRLGAFIHRHDRKLVDRRIDHVVGLFPQLRDRLDEPAGSLSGGQQQMVALAKSLLLEPEVLLIDELSLGLAPIVVESMIEVIENLKAAGQTMVLVEQSVNVALSVADRAVFLERGSVRFEGSAEELRQRDDLLRAVFLGAEGG
jgi:ABC-type branched-subunit amino acid transport system ATPase component/sugar phosphate permease